MTVFIEDIFALQIIDSRGNPTVEVEVELSGGAIGRAEVPSGASTGRFEAIELRDGVATEYLGKGVFKAIENINKKIAPELIGEDATCQYEIDEIMIDLDNSENKSNLGANAILGVSLAVAKAAANALELPLYKYLGGINGNILPTPMMNILNGGKHADNNLDIQEFMITPVGAKNFQQAIKMGVEIFHTLKTILHTKGFSTTVGDEGGFAPNLGSIEQAFDLLVNAIENAGYDTNSIKICIDVASSEFFKDGLYRLRSGNYTREELTEKYVSLVQKYPIISIEDGMAEEDWLGWEILTQKLGDKIQLVGDDLFVTNISRLKKGFEKHIANAILIKPNQIGTLSETLNVIQEAKRNGYKTIISHRSGETEDTFIADLSVAINSGQIKTGSLSRSERTAKYNQLIRIEQELGEGAKYLGLEAFR